ncbi:SRPBCC family protein [Terrabacter sp. GCM10028922]|uniref:SRPBCC family protein n=1 Tax=Terrabacter sp. GCM10028922 TaxID=3273428 RepID=UPI003606790C
MSKVIEASTDIARTPQEVFDYVSDPARLPDWQPSVNMAAFEPPGVPAAVGIQGHEVRRIPGGGRTFRWEVTECEPGRRWSIRGIDGAVRAHVTLAFAPTRAGTDTHVNYRIWFEGHGIGKLIRLLARQGARKEVPASLALLKQRLEATSARPESPRSNL